MIKINLVKAQRSGGGGSPGGSLDGTEGFVTISDDEIRKQGITRLLIIMIFPAALFAWETQTIPAKKSALQSKQAKLGKLIEKNEASKKVVDEIKNFETQQKKIQAQIDIIEKIKRSRMQEVRVLDFIQRQTPNKIWLNRIEVESGRLKIHGNAMKGPVLNNYMEALSRSIYLRDVRLVGSIDGVDEPTGLTVEKFEISCDVESPQ